MASSIKDLETSLAELADHLKPSAGAYVQSLVTDVKNALASLLADVKGELAYLHSRIDQGHNDQGQSPANEQETSQ
jgi:hypothetical protein